MKTGVRTALLESGFLEGPWFFLGDTLRPITLGTVEVCRRMGIEILKGEERFESLSPEEQAQTVARFHWAHTEEPEVILQCLRDGVIPSAEFDAAPTVCALFLHHLKRFNELLSAASVDTVPRPGEREDETPANHVTPCWLADFVWTLNGGRVDAEDEFYILWGLPLVRAVQYYHCKLRDSRRWTVPQGMPASAQAAELTKTATLLSTTEVDPFDV